MSTASFSIPPQYFPRNATRNNATIPIASLRTTPKFSDIKQYYALGFYRSIIQTGQHEDGFSLHHCIWASAGEIHQLGKLKSSGGILTHILAFRTGCWPGPHLAVGQNICTEPLPGVCLRATLWLTMVCMFMHKTQSCSSHLVRKGDSENKVSQNTRWQN